MPDPLTEFYVPPSVGIGWWLNDEILGKVQVGSFSDGRVSWPCQKKNGKRSLILCGDLVRAVANESSADVQYLFGVGPVTVWKWRKALGVTRRSNAGTQSTYVYNKSIKLSPERAARGRTNVGTPDALAKMAATKRGRKMHPKTRAALLAAVKKSKPAGWGKRANAWMRAGKRDAT